MNPTIRCSLRPAAATMAGMCCLLGALMMAPGPSWAAERGITAPPRSTPASIEEARVIVKYRADSTLRRAQSTTQGEGAAGMSAPRHAARLSTAVRASLQDGRVLGPHTQALRAQGLSSTELARRLRAQPEVEWAVVDGRRRAAALPNDPFFAEGQTQITPGVGQWFLRAPNDTFTAAINATGAWDITTGSPRITVAVLDTGIRATHPDLAEKLHAGYDFVGDVSTAQDGNGRDSDPTDPGDWADAGVCGSGEPASASSWHGTQVAGLIGAGTNNGIGGAGVGWQVMVLPIRVLGRCGGFDSDIIAGMLWAAGLSSDVGRSTPVIVPNPNPARVLNLSLGAPDSCSQAYVDTLARLNAAGVVSVMAAGNDTGMAVNTPANCPGALAVSGVRHAGTKVGYSNIGPEVALAAPAGNCVLLTGNCLYPLLTTTNLGLRTPGANGYSSSERPTLGTSFAAPLVAGTVGLMLSLDSSLTPEKVKAILQSTARPFPTTGAASDVSTCRQPDDKDQLECYCTATTCGAGMLDTFAAVMRVRADLPGAQGANPGSGGGGGGGSSGVGWVLGLLLGALALRRSAGR